MRGEYWKFWKFRQDWKGLPPLARGIRARRREPRQRSGITPACAGNTSVACPTKNALKDHPRLRGEYHPAQNFILLGWGSPPLARGIHRQAILSLPNHGITPACAGNTPLIRLRALWSGDHPRLRGEYQCCGITPNLSVGSPPLARGIQEKVINTIPGFRITPACAGNTAVFSSVSNDNRDHPRLRGEYQSKQTGSLSGGGSPPLARGIPMTQAVCAHPIRITPACAGNTTDSKLEGRLHRDHPRLRGEYEESRGTDNGRLGSPPLARGIHLFRLWHGYKHRITPACAGNTNRSGVHRISLRDHPRLRGEY